MTRWLVALGLALVAALPVRAEKAVTIAYQDMVVPLRWVQQTGELERATGYKIRWRQFGGGGDVIRAMASGDVQVGEAGSAAIATAVSQGLDVELVWILDDIGAAEALVVRDGAGIDAVAGLKGRKVATPFVSTSHFHLLFALELAGLRPVDVQVLNMRPPEIAAAWARGDIDAAFIWDPVLATAKRNGKVLVTSGELCRHGKCTFDGLVVSRKFALEHREFVAALVRVVARADAEYRRDPARWNGDRERIAAVARWSGAKPEDVPAAMALYAFPPAADQASPRWLGGGTSGGAAKALLETARFLHAQGRIQQVLPDYAGAVDPAFAAAAAASP